MEKRKIFRLALIGSITTTLSILYIGFGIPVPESVVSLQPSDMAVSAEQFLIPINEYPVLMLRFLMADEFLILGGLLLYLGFYTLIVEKSRLISAVGLGIGLFTVLLDISENAFLISYAQQSTNGTPVSDPALPLLYVITNLKMMGSYAGFLIFGLAWPRGTKLDLGISGMMILYTITGLLCLLIPRLSLMRGIFLLLSMTGFIWYFAKQLHTSKIVSASLL